MEEKVTIAAGEISLEGRFRPGSKGGVVISHPHPLFGGSMDNHVVWTAALAFQARRWATLCFNFRGVGESTGTYGAGLAEVEDLAAALRYLKTRSTGPHYLVGYSFGAYVAAQAMQQGLEAQGVLLIAPPIAFMDLAFLAEVPGLQLIIVGDGDELCPLGNLEALLARRAATVEVRVIAGADHFFSGREEKLFQALLACALPGISPGPR